MSISKMELSTDDQLRENISAEFDWDPRIDAKEIVVSVADGVVTLSGYVPTYAQKVSAGELAMRVRGVRAVAQELEVRPTTAFSMPDDEIARRALEMIKWNVDVPGGWIKLIVDNGYITLSGEVDWQFQRQAAEDCIRQLGGLKGTFNHITLRRRPQVDDLERRIEAALRRSAEIEAHAIRVAVYDDHVMLEGRVRTPYERKVLERAIWAAPGVRSVDDRVEIGEPQSSADETDAPQKRLAT